MGLPKFMDNMQVSRNRNLPGRDIMTGSLEHRCAMGFKKRPEHVGES